MKRLLITLVLILPHLLFSLGQNEDGNYSLLREKMVKTQIASRNIKDEKILNVMKKVPRHLFMPASVRHMAYEDHPVPIGEGQTISQPYIVALMTEALELKGNEKVLEIGTGSGYQASVLAGIVKEVFTIEIKEKLYKQATVTIRDLGISNIKIRFADGYFGWEEHIPFDCIMITAAVNHIPIPLFKQLKENGKMILPLGNPYSYQNLVLVTKTGEDYIIKEICGVLFVPMTGKALSAK